MGDSVINSKAVAVFVAFSVPLMCLARSSNYEWLLETIKEKVKK